MLLAKKREINPFTTHANLISLHMEDSDAFEDYLTDLIDSVHKLTQREISVYKVDRKMSKVVIHLAIHHSAKVPKKPVDQYDHDDWNLLRGLLLENAHA